jgi:hypothetical protein
MNDHEARPDAALDRIRDGSTARDADYDPREKRFYLALDDDIVRAPSIGNKTAERLVAAGVPLVRDFLDADPEALSQRLRTRYITPQRVRDWQAQARLVCTVPWLRGTHAQLLVGAGYPTAHEITQAEPDALCAAILRFATTRDGQSILRSGPPPDVERITKWIEFAAQAEPARAA